MSFVGVAPELLETAAADAARIGSAVRAGNLAAVIPTTELATAGADEVSAAIAAVFGAHAQEYQAAAAQAATYYEQFVGTLSASAAAYTSTEATIASSLAGAQGLQAFVSDPLRTIGEAWVNSPLGQELDPIVNAPTDVLFGRDLIGNGVVATSAPSTKIVVDFVRHGESIDNAANLMDTAVPGTGLTALGQQQALTVATLLNGQGPFAGIFSSQLIRTQETAAPLAGMLGMNVQPLPGLNEINAGILNGLPEVPLGILYLPGPLAWTLGLPIVPMLAPGSGLFSGLAFDQGFTNALQTMYAGALAHPVLAANGQITDVAYSSEFAIEVGTLMNVKNPDLLLMLTHPLTNTGIVVVQGDPRDGWNLVSWDGVPVPPASLPTELFVDVRDLVMAPQLAAYNGWEALLTGNPTTIVNSIATGVDQVGTATAHFPVAVTQDVVDALGGSPADSSNPIINVSTW
ncbi:MAG: PE domain-containing protein [Mycobacterium sp.]|uniref:PE domain-containing protein n=2 Tax=Mycobacterium sp. TaxID=1785 RepID=UPI003F992C14